METNQARPLAYNLAKDLDPEKLEEISGGANSWGISSQHTCLRPSGAIGSLDAEVDISIDW